MEKLFVVLRVGLFSYILLASFSLKAQEKLIIYSVKGEPKIEIKGKEDQKAVKGFMLKPKHIIALKKNDTLLIIAKEGKTFHLTEQGNYSYKDIFKNEIINKTSSFTKKFFSYVWDQFIINNKEKGKIGVVYRNDNLVILEPADNVKLFSPEITFLWNTDFENSFFHLKNTKNNHITKIGVQGNSLTLFVDNNVLTLGNTYKWAISKEKFPDLNQINYSKLTLLTSKEFNELKLNLSKFQIEMQNLGFSEQDIKKLLCKDYKLCY
jgi:hypothetical protein